MPLQTVRLVSCRIVKASPVLASRAEFSKLDNLSTVDVMAVRLWLDQRVNMPTPSNVAVGFNEGVGATFFDLTVLQVPLRLEHNLSQGIKIIIQSQISMT